MPLRPRAWHATGPKIAEMRDPAEVISNTQGKAARMRGCMHPGVAKCRRCLSSEAHQCRGLVHAGEGKRRWHVTWPISVWLRSCCLQILVSQHAAARRRGQAALAGVQRGGLRKQPRGGGPCGGGGCLSQHRAAPQARAAAHRLLPLLHGVAQRAGARTCAHACMHAAWLHARCLLA